MPHQCTSCRRTFPDGSKEMLSGCPDCGGNKFQFRPASATGGDASGTSAGAAEAGSAGAEGGDPGAADAGPAGSSSDSASPSGDGAAATGTTGAQAAAHSDEPPEPPEPPESSTGAGSVAETVAGATERVRDFVSGGDREWPAVGREGGAEAADADVAGSNEDTAQASARSSVVEREELPDPPEQPPAAEPDDVADGDDPSLEPDVTTPDAAPSDDGTPGADADGVDAEARTADAEPGSAPFTGSGDREETPDLAELRAELNDQFESIKIVDRGQYELNLMELYDREEYIISLLEDGRYAIEVPETWRED